MCTPVSVTPWGEEGLMHLAWATLRPSVFMKNIFFKVYQGCVITPWCLPFTFHVPQQVYCGFMCLFVSPLLLILQWKQERVCSACGPRRFPHEENESGSNYSCSISATVDHSKGKSYVQTCTHCCRLATLDDLDHHRGRYLSVSLIYHFHHRCYNLQYSNLISYKWKKTVIGNVLELNCISVQRT